MALEQTGTQSAPSYLHRKTYTVYNKRKLRPRKKIMGKCFRCDVRLHTQHIHEIQYLQQSGSYFSCMCKETISSFCSIIAYWIGSFNSLLGGISKYQSIILPTNYVVSATVFFPNYPWPAWTCVSVVNRNSYSKPTPKMPLWLGLVHPSDGLLLNCMPDTGASQTIISLDAARRAILKINPMKIVLKNASDAHKKLSEQSRV